MPSTGEWIPLYDRDYDPLSQLTDQPRYVAIERKLVSLLPVFMLADYASTVTGLLVFGLHEAELLAAFVLTTAGIPGLTLYFFAIPLIFYGVWRLLPRPYGLVLVVSVEWTWLHHSVTNLLLMI